MTRLVPLVASTLFVQMSLAVNLPPNCLNDSQCVTTFGDGMICNHTTNQCICRKGYTKKDDHCVPMFCSQDSDCLAEVANTVCWQSTANDLQNISSFCTCALYYYDYKRGCRPESEVLPAVYFWNLVPITLATVLLIAIATWIGCFIYEFIRRQKT